MHIIVADERNYLCDDSHVLCFFDSEGFRRKFFEDSHEAVTDVVDGIEREKIGDELRTELVNAARIRAAVERRAGDEDRKLERAKLNRIYIVCGCEKDMSENFVEIFFGFLFVPRFDCVDEKLFFVVGIGRIFIDAEDHAALDALHIIADLLLDLHFFFVFAHVASVFAL